MQDKFLVPNDPILVQIAEAVPVEQIELPQTKEFIERMLNVAYGEQKDRSKPVLVGLAAPQIGISKRIILVDAAADGKGNVGNLRIFINPEITWKSEEESEWYEGCYSTDRVCGIVSRPIKIRVKALELRAQPLRLQPEVVEEEFEGYVARIFQHEIDHLDGKEFITHISDDNNLHWVEEDEFPEYRNNEGWRNWPKKCPREKWNKIKGILS